MGRIATGDFESRVEKSDIGLACQQKAAEIAMCNAENGLVQVKRAVDQTALRRPLFLA